jgi:PQQ-dependent catabolism-associated beta-propeller protein
MHAVNGPAGPFTLDALAAAGVAALGVAYATGAARLRRRAGRRAIPLPAVAAFTAGWLVLFGLALPPVQRIAEGRFGLHMAQHQLLMLVAAPLLVLGRVWPTCLWAVAPWARASLGRARHRVAAAPLAVWILAAVVFWIWHVPAVFDAALRSDALHALEHLCFLGGALLSWHLALHGEHGRLGYGLTVCWLFATSMHTGLLGVLLTLSPAPWYTPPPGLEGARALEDQQLGGLLMWIPSGIVYAGAGVLIFAAWLKAIGRRAAPLGLALALSAAAGSSATTAAGGPLVYVSNEGSDEVTIVDGAGGRVVATIATPGRPRGLALSPDGARLYVALAKRDTVSVIDTATQRVVAKLPVGKDPECVDVSRDGARLYVSNEDTNTLSVVDARNGTMLAAIPVGAEPEGVTVSPDGRLVYVTGERASAVSVVDAATLTVVATITVGARPREAAFSRDGRRAFVTAENGATLSVIDVASHRVTATIPIQGPGSRPKGIALHPDGRTVYVANGRANDIAVIDLERGAVARYLPVGQRPWGLALSADGGTLYVANGLDDSLWMIDTVAETVTTKLRVGRRPWGVVIGR